MVRELAGQMFSVSCMWMASSVQSSAMGAHVWSPTTPSHCALLRNAIATDSSARNVGSNSFFMFHVVYECKAMRLTFNMVEGKSADFFSFLYMNACVFMSLLWG